MLKEFFNIAKFPSMLLTTEIRNSLPSSFSFSLSLFADFFLLPAGRFRISWYRPRTPGTQFIRARSDSFNIVESRERPEEGWADVSHSISCHSWIVCSCLWRLTGVGFSVLASLPSLSLSPSPFFPSSFTLFFSLPIRPLLPPVRPFGIREEEIISRRNNLYPLTEYLYRGKSYRTTFEQATLLDSMPNSNRTNRTNPLVEKILEIRADSKDLK